MINFLLGIIVIVLWSMMGWRFRKKNFMINIPHIWVKKAKNKNKTFKTYRYLETSKGVRCIEEPKYRII